MVDLRVPLDGGAVPEAHCLVCATSFAATHLVLAVGTLAASLSRALQVPFGEVPGVHYVALEVTKPMKWHPVTCSETQRDILDGSKKPEVDGSTPSLTTAEAPHSGGFPGS